MGFGTTPQEREAEARRLAALSEKRRQGLEALGAAEKLRTAAADPIEQAATARREGGVPGDSAAGGIFPARPAVFQWTV